MVTKNDLKVAEVYNLFGRKRYRICVQGTNIYVNVHADSEEEALEKALKILHQTNLDEDSLAKIRSIVAGRAKC